GLAPARAVTCVAVLADDTLKSHGASLGDDFPAIAFEMLVEQNAGMACLAQQVLQHPLALVERRWSDILTVKVEKIENIVGKALTPTAGESRLQDGVVGSTFFVGGDHLAVEYGCVDGDSRESRRKGSEPLGPIIASPGEKLRASAAHVRLNAITVIFDFMEPLRAFRRLIAEGGKARLDDSGQRRRLRTLHDSC